MSAVDVFLSYNPDDRTAVRHIAEQLRARGISYFLDEDDLIPGRPIQQALEQALSGARSVAVFLSASGFGHWDEPQMRVALDLATQRRLPVIPVLLPGAPEPRELPAFLLRYKAVEMHRGVHDAEALARLQWGIQGSKPTALSHQAGGAHANTGAPPSAGAEPLRSTIPPADMNAEATLLDRTSQWATLLNIVSRPQHASLLVHGTPHQRPELFIDRVRHYLYDDEHLAPNEPLKPILVSRKYGYSEARCAAGWARHLYTVFNGPSSSDNPSLVPTLRTQLKRASLMLIFGDGNGALPPFRTAAELEGLCQFLTDQLPAALAEASGANPRGTVRLLVVMQHPDGDDQAQVNRIDAALRQLAYHPLVPFRHQRLLELTLPKEGEVQQYVRERLWNALERSPSLDEGPLKLRWLPLLQQAQQDPHADLWAFADQLNRIFNDYLQQIEQSRRS